VLLVLLAGCSSRTTKLQIRSFDADGQTTDLFERFEEACFSHDARGSLDLVFRSVKPSAVDPSQVIRQIVHINAFWQPIPGRTFVEPTQCNATICYMIGTGPVSISYEGGGFITFKMDWLKRYLTGQIESGELAPLRRVGRPKDLLGQAQISGEFRAKRDKSRVLAILSGLRRELGPMPRYTRPPDREGPR